MADDKNSPNDPTSGFSPPKSQGVQFVRREEKGHYIWIREFLIYTAIPVLLVVVLGIWWFFVRSPAPAPLDVRVSEEHSSPAVPKYYAPSEPALVPPREEVVIVEETSLAGQGDTGIAEGDAVLAESTPPQTLPTEDSPRRAIPADPVAFELVGEGISDLEFQQVRTVLSSFWTSPSPEKMAEFVKDGESILPLMERHYQIPDLTFRRPIIGQKITVHRTKKNGQDYLGAALSWDDELEGLAFFTKPKGGGDALVLDWPSLVGFCDPSWPQLVEGGDGSTQILARVLIQQDSIYAGGFPSTDFVCYKLSHPYHSKLLFGYVRRATSLSTDLEEVTRANPSAASVTLRLLKLSNTATRSYLIEGMPSLSWHLP